MTLVVLRGRTPSVCRVRSVGSVGVGHGSAMICACATFGLLVVFPWGTLPLQSDWSLSCDHGLDNAS